MENSHTIEKNREANENKTGSRGQGQEEDKTSKGGGRGKDHGSRNNLDHSVEKPQHGTTGRRKLQEPSSHDHANKGRVNNGQVDEERESREKQEKKSASSSGLATLKNGFLQLRLVRFIQDIVQSISSTLRGESSNTETSPKGHDGKVQGDSAVDAAKKVGENDPPNGTDATSEVKEEAASRDHVDKEEVVDEQVNEESTKKQEKGSGRRMSDEAETSNARDDEFEMWFKKLQDSSRKVASAVGQAIMQRDTVTALKVYQNVEAKLNSQIFYPSRPKCLVYVNTSKENLENVNSLQEAYKGLNITIDLVHHLDELSYSDECDFIIIHIVSEVDEEEETRILDKLQLGNDARPYFVMIQRSTNDEKLKDLTFAIQDCLIVRSKHAKMTKLFTEHLKMHGEKNDISMIWKFTEEAVQYSHTETNCYGGLSRNVFLTEHDEYSEKQLVWTHK